MKQLRSGVHFKMGQERSNSYPRWHWNTRTQRTIHIISYGRLREVWNQVRLTMSNIAELDIADDPLHFCMRTPWSSYQDAIATEAEPIKNRMFFMYWERSGYCMLTNRKTIQNCESQGNLSAMQEENRLADVLPKKLSTLRNSGTWTCIPETWYVKWRDFQRYAPLHHHIWS